MIPLPPVSTRRTDLRRGSEPSKELFRTQVARGISAILGTLPYAGVDQLPTGRLALA